jgi:AbrB family looped-hinge helix DNA binding protein
MAITIDAAGCLVLPKPIREAAGIRAGMPLQVRARGAVIEIEPEPVELRLMVRDGVTVAVPDQVVTTWSADEVKALVDRQRCTRPASEGG